jgi:hypothetical protein
MSDEQTRLLEQILAELKEQTAFSREAIALTQTALSGQRKSMRIVRFAIAAMLLMLVTIVVVAIMSPGSPDFGEPRFTPAQRARATAP